MNLDQALVVEITDFGRRLFGCGLNNPRQCDPAPVQMAAIGASRPLPRVPAKVP